MVNILVVDDMAGPFIEFMDRGGWLAEPHKVPRLRLHHPLPYVRVTYTGCQTTPKDEDECEDRIFEIQQYEMRIRFLNDISPNFLIGPTGIVYEGRGWDYEPDRYHDHLWSRPHGDQYKKFFNKCIDFSFVGDYGCKDPPWHMIRSVLDMIEYGVKIKKIKPNFKIFNYRTNYSML